MRRLRGDGEVGRERDGADSEPGDTAPFIPAMIALGDSGAEAAVGGAAVPDAAAATAMS
jgi:hypothetical protein